MTQLDAFGKKVFRVISELHATSLISRTAERVVSQAHYPALHAAVTESMALCENGIDASLEMLRIRDMQTTFSMTEAQSAMSLAAPVPSSDPGAAKVQLRSMHESLAGLWLSVASSATGADAASASAFAADHAELATRLGPNNGSPEIA